MSIEEKAKAYNEALEQAKKELATCGSMDCEAARQIFRLFPQLQESEDERIIKTLQEYVKNRNWMLNGPSQAEVLAWLEKQKGNQYFVGYAKGYSEGQLNPKPKEQKPVDDSDFKTKLAEYIMKNRTGYSYHISSESILQMAKEELIKRGELKEQKPAWSEDDKSILEALICDIERLPMQGVLTHRPCDSYIKFLKALRPSWKPSELEKGALRTAIHILTDERNFPKAAAQLQNILDAFERKESRKED